MHEIETPLLVIGLKFVCGAIVLGFGIVLVAIMGNLARQSKNPIPPIDECD